MLVYYSNRKKAKGKTKKKQIVRTWRYVVITLVNFTGITLVSALNFTDGQKRTPKYTCAFIEYKRSKQKDVSGIRRKLHTILKCHPTKDLQGCQICFKSEWDDDSWIGCDCCWRWYHCSCINNYNFNDYFCCEACSWLIYCVMFLIIA